MQHRGVLNVIWINLNYICEMYNVMQKLVQVLVTLFTQTFVGPHWKTLQKMGLTSLLKYYNK